MITFDYLWKEWILPFIHAAFWAALIKSKTIKGVTPQATAVLKSISLPGAAR